MKKILFVCLAIFTVAAFCAGETTTTQVVPTAAVLPFEVRDRSAANAEMGKSVAELLNVALQESGSAELVERADLDKALTELQLSAVGLTDKGSQVKLGRIVGAKILISGALFKAGDKNFMVVKLIGTETSRVLGVSVSGTDNYTAMVPELATKVIAILAKQSPKLLPKIETITSVTDELKNSVKGDKRKVFITVKENINMSTPDPAAETELRNLLLALGFEVVETREAAAFVVKGEAVAANAGNYHKFTSAAARVELAIYGKDGKLLATGSAKETLAGATYIIAAKDAISQAALRLAGELCGAMK